MVGPAHRKVTQKMKLIETIYLRTLLAKPLNLGRCIQWFHRFFVFDTIGRNIVVVFKPNADRMGNHVGFYGINFYEPNESKSMKMFTSWNMNIPYAIKTKQTHFSG